MSFPNEDSHQQSPASAALSSESLPGRKAGSCQLGMGFEGWNILTAAGKIDLFKVNVNLLESEGYISLYKIIFFNLCAGYFKTAETGSHMSLLEGAFSSRPQGAGALLWPEDSNPVALPYFH